MIDCNELYVRFHDGDHDAFSELVERHHARLVERVAEWGVDPVVAEGIVQNVFRQLAIQAHKFNPETGDVVGWMNWLADNRRRGRENWALANRLLRIEHEVAERIDLDARVQAAIDAGDNVEADRIMEEWNAEVERLLAA